MNKIQLGGHVPIKDGLNSLLVAARALRYNQVQTMLAPGRDYEPWEFDASSINNLKAGAYDIEFTVHLPYTINPCESEPRRVGFYKTALRRFLQTAEEIGAKRTVLHPGFKKALSEAEAEERITSFLESIWDSSFNARLLLETDAGSKNGSKVGSADFIQRVIEKCNVPNLGMCIDTEHLYARGVDLNNDKVRADFLEKYGHYVGLVHLNSPDPGVTLGSHTDRHNTPFTDRKDINPDGMIKDLSKWPMILERRSLQVQEQDNIYVRDLLGEPYIRQKA